MATKKEMLQWTLDRLQEAHSGFVVAHQCDAGFVEQDEFVEQDRFIGESIAAAEANLRDAIKRTPEGGINVEVGR